jgi:hypothetical protein
MNKRFLEIDSAYRNRKENPNPAEFTVLISQSGTKDINNAYDPVCLSSPIKIFNPDKLATILGSVQTNSSNTVLSFLVTFPNNTGYPLSHEPDYYTGSSITVNATSNIISDWTYMSTAGTVDLFLIDLLTPLSSIPAGNVIFNQSTDVASANPVFFIEGGTIANNFYTSGCLIYNQTLSCTTNANNYRKIISYDGTSKLAGIDVNSNPITPSWSLLHTYVMRKEIPKLIGNVQPGSTNYIIFLPINFPNYSEFYIGNFIRVLQTDTDTSTNNIRRIMKFGTSPYSLTLDSPLPFTPTNSSYFEILQFSRDNVVPFTYTGSTVSQQQMVCYEIELIDLVLPNITLKSGGRIAFYPYVYVELQNISGANSGNTNILYSNNPNATRMLFRAPIDDIPNPILSPFIKIDGDGAVQTIKFKPNDSFRFAVYLPNGELFETLLSENFSPLPPNMFIQISAEFSMKRL